MKVTKNGVSKPYIIPNDQLVTLGSLPVILEHYYNNGFIEVMAEYKGDYIVSNELKSPGDYSKPTNIMSLLDIQGMYVAYTAPVIEGKTSDKHYMESEAPKTHWNQTMD